MLSPIRFFTNKRYVGLWRVLNFDQPPVILCGCGRSGTTLLLSILSAHPDIHAIDFETKIFTKRPYRWRWMNHWRHLFQIWLILIGRPVKKTARRWLEKNPRNIEHLPEILREFGDGVRIINIVRDGRDVITSMHPETSQLGYHVEPARWIDAVSMGMKFKDHPQVLTIQYEELVSDLDLTASRIFEFLKIQSASLEDFHDKAQVQSHRAWSGKLQPLHQTSVRKWERPEFKNRISEFMEKEEVISLLKAYGYIE